MTNKQETQEAALQHIKNNGKCIFRRGWAYRGTCTCDISKEEALQLLPQYSFGIGFHILSWTELAGQPALEFNELSVHDME